MDDVNLQLQRAIEGKQLRRRELARLPFPEKIRIIIQLQKIAAPLFRARGRKVRVWDPS